MLTIGLPGLTVIGNFLALIISRMYLPLVQVQVSMWCYWCSALSLLNGESIHWSSVVSLTFPFTSRGKMFVQNVMRIQTLTMKRRKRLKNSIQHLELKEFARNMKAADTHRDGSRFHACSNRFLQKKNVKMFAP